MGLAAAVLLGLGLGCSFDPEGTTPAIGAPDAFVDPLSPDADPLAPDAAPAPAFNCQDWTHLPQHFDPCAIDEPFGPLTLYAGTWELDTSDGTLTPPDVAVFNLPTEEITQSGVPNAVLVSVDSFVLETGAILRIKGDRPLIIASWSTIDIDGDIELGSEQGGVSGPGADPGSCDTHSASAGENSQEGGGGGGGGLGGLGGVGGDSNGASGGGGGGPATPMPPALIKGGCPGADGGKSGGGNGGGGGGAILFAAAEKITVTGSIASGGAGGEGGDGGGGGGGGTGGYVGFDAQTLRLGAGSLIAVNGGGGGGGGKDDPGADGADGQLAIAAAGGGNGDSSSDGNGGDGGFLSDVDGAGGGDAQDNDGFGAGGGGGGAVGMILRYTVELEDEGGMTSPAMLAL